MDLQNKLEQMDAKLDSIQGDVNVLATLNKEDNRDTLKNLLNSKFGRSKNRRKVWLAADGEKRLEEIADETGLSIGSVHPAASKLNDQGMLRKAVGENGTTYYWKSEITTGIGLEQDVRDYLSDD